MSDMDYENAFLKRHGYLPEQAIKRIAEMKEELDKSMAALKVMRKTSIEDANCIVALEAHCSELQRGKDELFKECDELEAENQTLRDDKASLIERHEATITDLQQENATLRESNREALADCEGFIRHVNELEALLTRVLVGGNARLPTQLLMDIRTALGDEDE